MFDPEADGPPAIRGGCPRCQDLQTIFEKPTGDREVDAHLRAPPPPKVKVDPDAERQQSLFASFS